MAGRSILVSVTGTQALAAHIARLNGEATSALAKGLTRACEEIITDAKEHYVPVDTGALKNSGHVKPPRVEGDRVIVECGFGGAAAPYAIYVHEDLSAHHPVGEAKYLEKPALKKMQTLSADLAEELGRAGR